MNWVVNHMENTSYEEAQNVRISFYSNTLRISKGTYNASGSDQSMSINSDGFSSGEISVATLSKGKRKILWRNVKFVQFRQLIITNHISVIYTLFLNKK